MKQNYLLFFSFLLILSCSDKKSSDQNLNSENNLYDKAYEFLESNEKDSAFLYFNNAKNIFAERNDSARAGNCLVNMAIIEADKGDYFGGQETALSAIKFLNENENKLFPVIYSNYNNLGIVSKSLKDYKKSIAFFDQALKFSSDTLQNATILNNKASCFKDLKDYNSSIKISKSLLNDINFQNDKKGYSRALDHLAFTRFLQNPYYLAEKDLQNALSIRINENDLWGQNASHAHLSDYYKNKNEGKSLFHAHKMYAVAKQIKSPDDELEALQKLISLESNSQSKNYFKRYEKLADSLQTSRNKARNQFALIKFESEKNLTDYLQAKTEIIENKYQLLQRNIALVASFIISLLGFLWYQKRQKRLRQEKDIEVKNTALKFSKKIHDVVANGLYQIMVQVENKPDLSKEMVLNDIEKMYEISRDISHENQNNNEIQKFPAKIFEMISSYSSDHQKVFMTGNNEVFWHGASEKMKTELFYVLRELMVNMKKHSQAKIIVLKFEKSDKDLKIKYTDNGVGMVDFDHLKAKGISNTENRIAEINGDITFEKNMKDGLQILISVPKP